MTGTSARSNRSRRDRWVFGDRDSGIYLRRFAWTKIVRHQLVMGAASPDDPALDQYWARRRRTSFSLLGGLTASLLLRQQGRCPVCGTFLLHTDRGPQSPREWEQWTRTLTRALSMNALVQDNAPGDDRTAYRLTHAHCHHRNGSGPNKNQPRTPEGLA